MWPINTAQLADAIAPAAVPLDGLDPALATHGLYRAIAWLGPELGPRDVFFALEASHYAAVPAALARGAVCIVRSEWSGLGSLAPDLRARVFTAAHPLAAFRRLAAFFRPRLTFPIVAVGGSNGKTTTKELLATILAAGGKRVTATPGTNNGWVGLPITLCQALHTEPAPDALVLEIGIDELGAMEQHVAIAAPDVALLTALGVEHLAGLVTHDNVVREELVLLAGSKRRIWLASDPALAPHLGDARPGDVVVHEEEERAPAGIDALAYRWRAASPTSGVLALRWKGEAVEALVPLPGAHNGRNAALAIAAALVLGRDLSAAAASFGAFRGPKQRCVVRELPSGCTLIDDSYNASPASVEAALDVMAGFDPRRPRLVLFGDMLDLGTESERLHRAIAPRLDVAGAHVRLYGHEASKLKSELTAVASIGTIASDTDPSDLIDLFALDDAIVLVKGSRGMALERAVARIEALSAGAWDATAIGIGVVGDDSRAFADAVRATRKGRTFVRALSLEELEAGAAATRPYDIAIMTGVAVAYGVDPERGLAAIAQLLLHLRAGGVAVLIRRKMPSAEDSREDHDREEEALALLAGILPPHAAARHATWDDALSVVISELDRRIIARSAKIAES